ncbi:MAG: ABC transporter ATP-binding protein [Clostridia bacterium]|nr:ABC transporter ATP-binding protein [Clostridia bacterium]
MSAPILTCNNLCKSYTPGKPVLHNLNISLSGGKIVGLLGPNGCGKSTLLKMISGILVPDSGSIEVCGIPRSEETNAFISYLPERTYFNSWMRVEELITYFRDFFPDFDEVCARKMLSDLSIDTTMKLRSLSKGNKEKVQLVLVMSRKAKLYLLDEPIGGVDPAARDYILSTIIGNYSPDAAVIITTHLIYDIEPVLDEFAFMGYGGQILLSGIADEVREERGKTLDELFREVFRCSRNA